MYNNKLFQKGFSLVELLVAMGLFGMMLPVIFTGFIATRDGRPQLQNQTKAMTLMQETLEAVRVVRERGWIDFAVDGVYHPKLNDTQSTWVLGVGPETLGDFTRSLTISSVQRNDLGEIVTSGGEPDPSTKRVTLSVNWTKPHPGQLESSIYFMRYLDNLSFTHTTFDDFSATGHQKNNIDTTSVTDGELQLSPFGPGKGNWCEPRIVAQHDLPRNGFARAITAIPFNVYVGTGLNASGKSLAYLTVTDTQTPVTALMGTIDGYKTNDVFSETGYSYLAIDSKNGLEIIIVNTNNMTKVGDVNLPNNGSAKSIFVQGAVGYAIMSDKLYLFDLSNKTGTRPVLSSVSLAGMGSSVYVVGTYAYVSNSSSSNQLQIINVSNPSSPALVSSLTVSGSTGRDVYVSADQTRAYLVTAGSVAQPEFFLINSENKTSPNVISTYDTNGMDPQAVDVVLANGRAIIVGTGGEEYQVVSIYQESALVRCGGAQEANGIHDIATVLEPDGDAFAYIVTGRSDRELEVIEGGPGSTYSLDGWYESAAFDASQSTAFNRFTTVVTEPATTVLSYQMAVADPGASGCVDASYQFVGPDKTADTFFTEDQGVFPFDNDGWGYENPGQCMKYKVYFSTENINNTPVLESILVNYSP